MVVTLFALGSFVVVVQNLASKVRRGVDVIMRSPCSTGTSDSVPLSAGVAGHHVAAGYGHGYEEGGEAKKSNVFLPIAGEKKHQS